MNLKAFVFDIDGTICDYEGLLNLEAVHSIRWLRKRGFEVLLASGRGPWDTFYLGVFIGCSKVSICENGGVLMTSPADMKLYSDKTDSLRAYDLLSRHFDVRVKPVSARLTEVVLLRTFDAAAGQVVIDQNNLPVKVNDSRFALHLTKKGIDKSVALLEGLRLLEIDPKQVVVVGDSETDVPMFDVCGYSVAVGNAPEMVKSRANYACKEEIGDGAAEAVSHVVDKLVRS